ncbi:MAG: hypothetical protein ABI249_01795 [Ornithinibacter sp.]
MFDTILGIPVHALVVHAVVVMAPLTALLLLLFGVSARFRSWSGVLTPAVATLTMALTVLCVVAAVGVSIDVALVGHSGAKAVWNDVGAATPSGDGD